MNKRLVIIGAGGHGRVAADCALAMDSGLDIVFLDAVYPDQRKTGIWPILAKAEQAAQFDDGNTAFFVAIGNNLIRDKVMSSLSQQGLEIATLIHPTAHVSPYANVGQGSIVCANAVIGPMAEIGQGCIINTVSSVDHDCVIHAYVHISVGVRLAGDVNIQTRCFIGINSCVIQGLNIGQDSVLGAGATLISDLPANSTALGTPAKVIEK